MELEDFWLITGGDVCLDTSHITYDDKKGKKRKETCLSWFGSLNRIKVNFQLNFSCEV